MAVATASRTGLGQSTVLMADAQQGPDTRIPLVAHIITDDDLGLNQGSKHQPVNLKRMIKLLTDPHSMMLYDRHVHALQRIVRHYQKGFPMKELVQVFKILNVCADRVDSQPLYEQPIVDILKLCALPYLKEKSSDELIYEQIVIESVSQLGYLMRIPSDFVRKQICVTLRDFYHESPAPQDVQNDVGKPYRIFVREVKPRERKLIQFKSPGQQAFKWNIAGFIGSLETKIV